MFAEFARRGIKTLPNIKPWLLQARPAACRPLRSSPAWGVPPRSKGALLRVAGYRHARRILWIPGYPHT